MKKINVENPTRDILDSCFPCGVKRVVFFPLYFSQMAAIIGVEGSELVCLRFYYDVNKPAPGMISGLIEETRAEELIRALKREPGYWDSERFSEEGFTPVKFLDSDFPAHKKMMEENLSGKIMEYSGAKEGERTFC